MQLDTEGAFLAAPCLVQLLENSNPELFFLFFFKDKFACTCAHTCYQINSNVELYVSEIFSSDYRMILLGLQILTHARKES